MPELSAIEAIRRRVHMADRCGIPLHHPVRLRLAQLSARLVSTDLIDALPWLQPSLSNEAWWSARIRGRDFGRHAPPEDPHSPMQRFLRRMAENACVGRQMACVWRCVEETVWAQEHGWFIVFDTLTFRDLSVAAEGLSTGWAVYAKRVRRAVGMHVYGSKALMRAAPVSDFARHCCVVEHGEKTGRVHMHVIWWLRDLPPSWARDPNAGRRVPDRRELSEMKPLWDYGFSTPIICRIGPDDAWARAGHQWPVDRKTGRNLVVAGPAALGSYVSKYLTKQHGSVIQWRTRMSRGLGLRSLRALLRISPTSYLRSLASPLRYPILISPSVSVPSKLLRAAAWSERMSRSWASTRHRSMICRTMMSRSGVDILAVIRASISSRSESASASALSYLSEAIARIGGSFDRQFRAHEWLEQHYSRAPPIRLAPLTGRTHSCPPMIVLAS